MRRRRQEGRLQRVFWTSTLTPLLASANGLRSDLLGAFASTGPVSRVLGNAPFTATGFVEAHGLAFILGVLLWRVAPTRSWHLTAVAVHVLLGTSNLVFRGIFTAADMLAVGYISTTLHWLFVALQLRAAIAGEAPTRSAAALAAQVP